MSTVVKDEVINIDFPQIAAGASGSVTLSCPGVVPPARVDVAPPAAAPLNWLFEGRCRGNDEITIIAFNGSGAAANPPNIGFYVTVTMPG